MTQRLNVERRRGVMMKTHLIAFLAVLSVSAVFNNVAWSVDAKSSQATDITTKGSDQEENVPKDQDQLLSPLQSNSEGEFLILDQDGKSPAAYEKFLPPDRPNNKPAR
jgi:hypothetical protein